MTSATVLITVIIAFALTCALSLADAKADIAYLHTVAHEVIDASRVAPDGAISNGGKNTTGYALRVPGGTQSFYPAFWIRDAAMMLGADLVPAEEVLGWLKVVARTQPDGPGLSFPHGLTIPGFSIPDHITLQGAACWFPGAYTEQGVGDYGYLPPADDAFYFIQMANEAIRLTKDAQVFKELVRSGSGERPLNELCDGAFNSIAVDPATGMVLCNADQGQTRVDWGFCDSVRKTGSCLMPSLLRWQAAKRLSALYTQVQDLKKAQNYQDVADLIQRNIEPVFFNPVNGREGMLLSATGLGHKDDVWASAFAIWLGVLPSRVQKKVALHLLNLYRDGKTVKLGQVRSIPVEGPYGGFWEKAGGQGSYQNGGYWATPTGWYVAALRKIDRKAGDQLLHEYADYVREHRASGAPFEWINPDDNKTSNANYASSAGLVYVALTLSGK